MSHNASLQTSRRLLVPGTFLKLLGAATSSDSSISAVEWSQEAGDVIEGGPFAVSSQRLTTALSLGSLTPGATYLFRLSATDAENNKAYGEVIVAMNSPPTSGSFAVSPTKG